MDPNTLITESAVYCLCEDESVIGRAFYVMEHVEGRIFWDQSLPDASAAERAAIYDELNRVVATLHRTDYVSLGLADYGKPGNFFGRQIDRWTSQYRAAEDERISAIDGLIEWLPANVPHEDPPSVCVVHGDYGIDNLMFHPTEPRVLAVLDWELSTLGHPLVDFAYHMMGWHNPPGALNGIAGLDIAGLGIPSERDYLERYLRRSGFQLSADWSFFLAFGYFRYAAILQGIARRAKEGTASSPRAKERGKLAGPSPTRLADRAKGRPTADQAAGSDPRRARYAAVSNCMKPSKETWSGKGRICVAQKPPMPLRGSIQ